MRTIDFFDCCQSFWMAKLTDRFHNAKKNNRNSINGNRNLINQLEIENMQDIAKMNIENLTSLWRKVSIPFQGFFTDDEFDYCQIPNSDWPNRLWFKQKVNEQSLNKAIETINSSSVNLSLSYWDDFDSPINQLIEKSGFTKTSEQIGMSLKLNQQFKEQNRLSFQIVTEQAQAKIWAELYPQSFGYRISDEILIRTSREVQYYLIHFKNDPIGTAITFQTDNIVGIHGVGIIPAMRKRGFAEEIMCFILNRACDAKIEYATLQSSAMGKGIYLRMGFIENFLMTNCLSMPLLKGNRDQPFEGSKPSKGWSTGLK